MKNTLHLPLKRKKTGPIDKSWKLHSAYMGNGNDKAENVIFGLNGLTGALYEKTCFCCMRTTKIQTYMCIRTVCALSLFFVL